MAESAQSPLAQFEIKELMPISIGETSIAFTNSAAFMAPAF